MPAPARTNQPKNHDAEASAARHAGESHPGPPILGGTPNYRDCRAGAAAAGDRKGSGRRQRVQSFMNPATESSFSFQLVQPFYITVTLPQAPLILKFAGKFQYEIVT